MRVDGRPSSRRSARSAGALSPTRASTARLRATSEAFSVQEASTMSADVPPSRVKLKETAPHMWDVVSFVTTQYEDGGLRL